MSDSRRGPVDPGYGPYMGPLYRDCLMAEVWTPLVQYTMELLILPHVKIQIVPTWVPMSNPRVAAIKVHWNEQLHFVEAPELAKRPATCFYQIANQRQMKCVDNQSWN